MNSKLLILSIFLFLNTSLSSIAALPGSQSTVVTQSPPLFTSTAPSASHLAGKEFIYNFSAFDPDLDPISFFIAGEEQSDAAYQAEGYWATSAQTSIWQSFTADATGFLTTAGILCYSSNTESDSVYIYSGSGTGGSVLYKAPLPMMNFYDYHSISIPVSSGVLLASGSTYTIEFKSTSNAITTYMEQNYLGNPYPGGRGYFSEDSDHPFITKIKPLKTFPVAAWPTLTDNGNGTGSLVGTPPGSAIGTFSEILIAKAGSDYVQQPITFEITNPILAPSGLFAIAADGQIELKWNKNAPANFGKYYIYGGTEPNPTSLIDSSASVSDTTLILSGLTNGTLYYFRLNAKSNGGVASGFSNEDAAVPLTGEGNALSFDGDGDYVSIPNLSAILSGKTALTISGWVYPRNPEGSFPDFDHFFGFRNDSDADFYIMQAHGTNLKAVIRTSTGAGEITASSTLIPNEWQHVAFTYDGSVIKLFHNGNEVGSSFASGTIEVGNLAFQMGYSNEGPFNYYLDGNVDEVQLWNKTQTQEEIILNYTLPAHGDEPFLLGAWHLDEPSGTIAFDASPNGNNGNLINGPAPVSSSAFFNATLPVELSSFNGKISDGKVVLNWSTASEKNNAGWEIQRQEDRSQKSEDRINANWVTIGFVAGKGTTTEVQNYVFSSPVTRNPSPVTLRLKQLDLDGTVAYSQILTIENKPGEFYLQQNYPNPFNPVTVINYQLASKGIVELRVFDMLGREVKTLVNQVKEAGNYSVDFSAENLPSGVYFYRLNAGNFSETKKMTILK